MSDRGRGVGIAVVAWAGKYVVGVRGPDGPLPGAHEFPGGKLAPDETPEEGAVRECLEETGLRVVAGSRLWTGTHEYPHGRVDLCFVLCQPESRSLESLAGSFQWVPATRLGECRFPAANEPVLQLLAAGLSLDA